jgi:hypothetical protein
MVGCRFEGPYEGDSTTMDECGRDASEDISFLEAEESYIGT